MRQRGRDHASFSTLRACDHVLVNARARRISRGLRRFSRDSASDFDVLVIGRGPSGAAAVVLARGAWSSGPRDREEALSAREDLRRRAHAARRPPAARHGPRRTARGLPALRRAALDRARRHPRARLARASRLPVVRIRGPAPRARRDGRRAGGEGRRDDLAGRRGDRAGRRRRASGRRDGARQGLRPRSCRSGPATSWSPTAPTPASAGPSAPPATARSRWAWRFAAISRARSTTSRGSRAISTSATGMATICPGMGGYFRLVTARSTSGSACSRPSRAGRTSTRRT